MKMRRVLVALLLSHLAVLPYGAAAAEPPGAAAQAVAPLTPSELQANDYVAWLQEQMKRMDAILDKVRRTESRHERRDLLRQYAMALRVTNALTNAVDPSLGIYGPRPGVGGGVKPPGKGKEMACPMMSANPSPAPGAPEGAPQAHH